MFRAQTEKVILKASHNQGLGIVFSILYGKCRVIKSICSLGSMCFRFRLRPCGFLMSDMVILENGFDGIPDNRCLISAFFSGSVSLLQMVSRLSMIFVFLGNQSAPNRSQTTQLKKVIGKKHGEF